MTPLFLLVSSSKLDGDLDLCPLVPGVGTVIAKESRLSSSNPFVLGFQGVSESVNTEI